MLEIARIRMLDGLKDAKFIFLTVLIMVVFLVNGVVYSERYAQESQEFRTAVTQNTQKLEQRSDHLQSLAVADQRIMQPPQPLAFIADGGGQFLPNVVVLNAFLRSEMQIERQNNKKMPIPPAFDWAFVIGNLMTLLTVLVSYSAVSGEKADGTLKLLLSNPVSRLKLFAGNYFGLLAVLLVSLLLGVAVNLLTINVMGAIPFSPEVFEGVGWALLMAVLCLSAFLLAGMAFSSMTSHPTVALVILLVLWVLVTVAVPGVARLTGERLVDVPSQAFVEEEVARTRRDIFVNAPEGAGTWPRPLDDPRIRLRAQLFMDITEASQRIRDNVLNAQIRQSLLSQTISAISASSLLSDGLQTLCGTGIHGVDMLNRNGERYRRQLHQFVVDRDSLDPNSPHMVYGRGREDWGADRGSFSMLPVPVSDVPRASAMWTAGGLSTERDWPAWHILLMLVYNLVAGLAAFVALMRYDPR